MRATAKEMRDVEAYFRNVRALADAIRELGEIPSGHLYARVMGFMTLEVYQSMIENLKAAGVVREEPSHLLVWQEPLGEEETG